jgi:hypothetical protein
MQEKSELPKYQYHCKTWGGFYNDEYKNIHGLSGGDFVFDSKQERQSFIDFRQAVSAELKANYLMIDNSEGFECCTRVTLHRVVEHQGISYYSTRDMGINYPFVSAKRFMENNWYPGFNDYPLGEDFEEYDSVKIVSEWITGAFQITDEE